MNKLLVIADDLTGALDTGVQFSKKGIRALVLTAEQLSFDRIDGASRENAEVLVVDTESRRLSAKESRDIVTKLVTDALAHGFRHFYKKTDSALRGNIGAELAGLLEAADDVTCLTFVPAFPKSRRVTRNGVHYIDGVEVGRSVFSKDPFTPVTLSSVAGIIHLQADILTENIARHSYAKAELIPERKTLRILDAESVEDLELIGERLKRGGNLNLLAGCAGFAEILPELLALPRYGLTLDKKPGGILVVSGSMNSITLEQLAYGEKIGFSALTLSLEQKLDASYPNSSACGDFAARVTNELKRSGRVIIRSVKDTDEAASLRENADESGKSRRVADNIGEIVLRIMNAASIGNLAVFGGDTLHGVLSKMGCRGVVPIAEITSGVVAAKALSDLYDCVVITKSGGLGEKNVLRQIEEFVFERE